MTQRSGDTARPLSRDRIISHALETVDEEGLDALSLRALGKRLGVSQTAFYRHVPDKAALLDGVAEAIWGEVLESFSTAIASREASTVEWRDVMRRYARALRGALLAHPNAVVLVLTHPISTPGGFSLVARVLAMLNDAGFEHPTDMLGLVTVVTVYTTGFAAAEASPPAGGAASSPAPGFSEALASMSEGEQKALEELVGQVMEGRWDLAEQFEVGLAAVLDGWRA